MYCGILSVICNESENFNINWTISNFIRPLDFGKVFHGAIVTSELACETCKEPCKVIFIQRVKISKQI